MIRKSIGKKKIRTRKVGGVSGTSERKAYNEKGKGGTIHMGRKKKAAFDRWVRG